jgi:hypothetical protein
MVPAVTELHRMLFALEEAPWPPTPWARHKFEMVLIACEEGRYADAYDGVLWSKDRFNRWLETAKQRPASVGPTLDDYRARVDAVRNTANEAYARMEEEAAVATPDGPTLS